jgi:NADH-quinone oxidoreductase subunit A
MMFSCVAREVCVAGANKSRTGDRNGRRKAFRPWGIDHILTTAGVVGRKEPQRCSCLGSNFLNDPYNAQYLFILVFLAVAVAFPIAPLVLARLVAPRKPTPIKGETYECGLKAKGDPWVQFRAGYYIYALVYVIFAVETVFLYPWAVAFLGLSLGSFIAVMIFLLLVVEGLVYAWAKGALEWK